ncbi:hypothetical protein HDU82_000598 [Entophlyctis luteolus]|nr:hypothetical protein HDU82_000598 [Entophlyctis luteolus]
MNLSKRQLIFIYVQKSVIPALLEGGINFGASYGIYQNSTTVTLWYKPFGVAWDFFTMLWTSPLINFPVETRQINAAVDDAKVDAVPWSPRLAATFARAPLLRWFVFPFAAPPPPASLHEGPDGATAAAALAHALVAPGLARTRRQWIWALALRGLATSLVLALVLWIPAVCIVARVGGGTFADAEFSGWLVPTVASAVFALVLKYVLAVIIAVSTLVRKGAEKAAAAAATNSHPDMAVAAVVVSDANVPATFETA